MDVTQNQDALASCRKGITSRWGAIVYGEVLWRLLGYKSDRGYQLAIKRGDYQGKLPLHRIQGRKGMYAQASDLATWLVNNDSDWKNRLEEVHRSVSVLGTRSRKEKQ